MGERLRRPLQNCTPALWALGAYTHSPVMHTLANLPCLIRRAQTGAWVSRGHALIEVILFYEGLSSCPYAWSRIGHTPCKGTLSMELSLDRRRLPDRRARPMTLWSVLRWKGRRTSFRRVSEGHQAYVDGLTRPTVVLALCVVVGSLLDALLTLRYLQDGGGEAIR